MHIEVGKYAGFCDGVKYAVEHAFSEAAKSDESIYVDGHLIHNPQTLKMLEESGVITYEDSDDISILDGKTVIVRAHGISPERRKTLLDHAGNIVNLTCKYVGRIQSIVKKYSGLGYRVVVIGNVKHPEVVGVCGFAEDVYVVINKEDVSFLPKDSKKLLIVAQTTLQRTVFDEIVSHIKNKYPNEEILIKNTICKATEQRQNEILDIAKRNDVVLVIGGKESSNTKNLYNIASSIKPSYYVEYREDLDNIDLSKYKRVGIMAGASTPDWLIEEVTETIKEKYSSKIVKLINSALDFFIYGHVFFALGAFLLSYAVYNILSQSFTYYIGLITALYYLSMSIMNGYTNDALAISDKNRYRIYQKYRMFFYSIIALSSFFMIIISYKVSIDILMLSIVSSILGIAYNLSFRKLQYMDSSIWMKLLRKLVPFKALIISSAVTTLLNGSILLLHRNILKERTLAYMFSVSMVFLFMFIRQSLIEIKSSQSDKIAGAITLTTYIDSRKLIVITATMPIILLTAMIIGLMTGWYPLDIEKIKYFIPVIYSSIVSLVVMKKRILTSRHLFSFLIDSPLYMAFFVALINF